MIENPRILALDVATTTGWAVAFAKDDKPLFGAHRAAPGGSSAGYLFLNFARWLTDMIAIHQPDAIFFEAPLDPRRIGAKTNAETFRRLITMAGLVEMVAQARGVNRVYEAEASAVRRHFIGGNPKREEAKRQTMRLARSLGCDVKGDDEADAVALFFYAAAILNPRNAHLTAPLFRGRA
jgi:hypothetical protein